jgi:UDP:flavonoid glycosyltransferase YjiC (YdhE family)
VILGHTWDAVLKAKMLEREGAGRYLPPTGPAAQTSAAVAQLLDSPAARERALELRSVTRDQPTPASAVRDIERRMGVRPYPTPAKGEHVR